MPDSSNSPSRPRLTWRQREAREIRGAILDPGLVPAGEAFATVYEPDVLLMSPWARVEGAKSSTQRGLGSADPRAAALEELQGVATKLGWTLAGEDLEDPERGPERSASRGASRSAAPAPARRREGVAQTRRVRIEVAPDARPDAPQVPPDAWRLLVEAKKTGVRGFGLNHLLTIDELGSNPFKGNPFKGNPFKGNPFKGNPFKGNPAGMEGYAYPGYGGRQPVAFVGPDLPVPSHPLDERPVVAILDTGCGHHPWLNDAVIADVATVYGGEIGVVDPLTDPDAHPSSGSPLDGVVDSAAGHGTFIAGIVLQVCPEARILPVRVADGEGVIRESDLIGALGRIVAIVEEGKHRIDVVNLSFSYYHESPEQESVDSELYDLLRRLRAAGTVVVCSAGNDATDRPASPASLHHWDGDDCGIGDEGDIAPLVTVGALNPSLTSVALFSNVGSWVKTYVRGVSVLSTVPTSFQGGIQPDLSSNEYGRRRNTLDIDDFGSGFAVWSGTSFAAPLVAGRIAAKLVGPRPGGAATTGTNPTVTAASAAAAAVSADADAKDASVIV
ncbi:S8 family peptidase [Microbacterium kyungheense]|uniref:Subtilase family protein n=1 Tax=Microbacterium kyungheense TaxID=1263636 RepID=A0A543FJ95_9MICO|nr:S8 family serine peptidase [Microbacterium kyungheense]TQM33943.1 subtilase family protein [Microbacterium kyungheense]